MTGPPWDAETEQIRRPVAQGRPWPAQPPPRREPPQKGRREPAWKTAAGWLLVAIAAMAALIALRVALYAWHVGGPLTGHG